MPFELTIAEGTGRGRRFRFDAAEVSIGRAPGSDLLLVDAGVSRSHARIRAEGTAHVLLDAGSSNGTALNGTLVRGATTLTPGDRIGVGPLVFEFGSRRGAAHWMRGVAGAACSSVGCFIRARCGALPRWTWTGAIAGAGSCLLAAVVVSVHVHAAPAGVASAPTSGAASASGLAAAAAASRNGAEAPGEAESARGWYERGRRKLEERRVAPRNLYDAWRSFTTARRLVDGQMPAPPLDALPRLIEEAERELKNGCRKLLFTARRFERYGEEQRAQAVYREVLLHFPGDDPSGCRAEARQELSDAADGEGGVR
jgi:Inner membrane component of T3SS, cytoplasmic domain